MRISKQDWSRYQIDLQLLRSGLTVRKMDSRVGGVQLIRYHQDGTGEYDTISPVLRTRQELDLFIAGLRKGSDLREKEIREAIGKLFDEWRDGGDTSHLLGRLSIWTPA